MINVYSTALNARLDFSFKLIFEYILNDRVNFFDDRQKYTESTGIQINYSNEDHLPGFRILPNRLLFQEHLEIQYPEFTEWEGLPAFFSTPDSIIPFDLFAASFYLAVRYEEYLPSKRDRHNRFQARYSLAATKGFLEKPLINLWALNLARFIEEQVPEYRFSRSSFSYKPTIDIDNAWAFKNKGLFRSLFSSLKDISRGRWGRLKQRWSVLVRLQGDAYDNYDFIGKTLAPYPFRPHFFFLLNKNGKHDRSLSPRNQAFRLLIRQMAKIGDVGIHPSYNSYKNHRLVQKEKDLLKKILNKEITSSRQHYLKISFPETYRILLRNGITDDYSMGYSSRPGFRASLCTPYPFFDLLENKTTSLMIHPFQVMDVTLRDYRNFNANEAIQKIRKLIEETAAAGGTFVSLWHNESLGDAGRWQGWREVYRSMTQMASMRCQQNEAQIRQPLQA